MNSQELEALSVNTIRMLSVDAVQKANSGHPGLPMGAASMAYVLWTQFLKHNPSTLFGQTAIVLFCPPDTVLRYPTASCTSPVTI